jgi:hypothetical protein
MFGNVKCSPYFCIRLLTTLNFKIMAIYGDEKHNENMESIEQIKDEFYFYIDEKVTTWMRTRFCVEAHTREEAIERAKKSYEKLCEGEGWEEIPDCTERMSLKENEGCSTVEMYLDENQVNKVWENGEEM